MFLKAYANKL
jgi:hypothetical protein